MKDSKIIKWNIKWLVISTILVLGVVLLTSFTTTQKEISWEQKYHEVKKERDYYKKASEKLLKNWKECEEKVVKLIGKSK